MIHRRYIECNPLPGFDCRAVVQAKMMNVFSHLLNCQKCLIILEYNSYNQFCQVKGRFCTDIALSLIIFVIIFASVVVKILHTVFLYETVPCLLTRRDVGHIILEHIKEGAQ